jgi:hypothetical protein
MRPRRVTPLAFADAAMLARAVETHGKTKIWFQNAQSQSGRARRADTTALRPLATDARGISKS